MGYCEKTMERILEKERNGVELTEEEIDDFVEAERELDVEKWEEFCKKGV